MAQVVGTMVPATHMEDLEGLSLVLNPIKDHCEHLESEPADEGRPSVCVTWLLKLILKVNNLQSQRVPKSVSPSYP